MLQLSLELSDALILVNKVNLSSWRRQPQKQSLEPPTTGKKPTQALPVTDVCFDQVAYWPSPITNKKLMQIMQYDLQNAMFQMEDFSLLADRNRFVDFHTKPWTNIFMY